MLKLVKNYLMRGRVPKNKHELYEIFAVPEAVEQLGTKYKFWYKDEDGESFLFKEGRQNTGENWAEVICSEICDQFNLPHAQYFFAKYQDKFGVLSPQFVPNDARLVLGNEVLANNLKGYMGSVRYGHSNHTVRAVVTVLNASAIMFPGDWKTDSAIKSAADVFVGYLMLDALVGNTDRHHENWGFISWGPSKVELAPTFDHASSLGRELSNEKRLVKLTTKDKRQSIDAYVRKAPSALYRQQGDYKPLTTLDAFIEACKLREAAKMYWHSKLKLFDIEKINKFIENIPNEFMTNEEKKFAKAAIKTNLHRILNEMEG